MKHFNPSEPALKGLLPPEIFRLNIKIQLTLTNYLILHCISVSHVSFQPRGSMPSNADLGLQWGSRRLWQTFHILPRSLWPILCSGCCGNQPCASAPGQRLASAALACVASALGLPAPAKGEASESCPPLLGQARTWDFEGLTHPGAMLGEGMWNRVDE